MITYLIKFINKNSESTFVESVPNDTSNSTATTISTLSTLHLLTTNQMHNQVILFINLFSFIGYVIYKIIYFRL